MCLSHLDTRKVAQQVSLVSYFIIIIGHSLVFALQSQYLQVVLISIPQGIEVGFQLQVELLERELGVFLADTGVALLSALVAVEEIKAYGPILGPQVLVCLLLASE